MGGRELIQLEYCRCTIDGAMARGTNNTKTLIFDVTVYGVE